MKIVHATWEKRNLGVNCIEISCDHDDSTTLILRELEANDTEYNVLRIPTNRVDLLTECQSRGYRFIETMTRCWHDGKSFNLNPVQVRIADQMAWIPMPEQCVQQLWDEIRQPLFVTDRVSLDSRFSSTQAVNRYVNWIRDELEAGSMLYKVAYKKLALGFFALRPVENGECEAFLSGAYARFRNSGFGFCCHYAEVLEGIRLGADRVITSYSSNNRGAASVHLSMGHRLCGQSYTLVKHGRAGALFN